MTANALRGEVTLDLAGHQFDLRPSFAALVAVEKEAGSLFAMLDRAAAGDVRFADLGPLFWHCLAAAEVDRTTFERLLLEAGAASLLGAYQALLKSIFGQV